jgi:hypothetical protein
MRPFKPGDRVFSDSLRCFGVFVEHRTHPEPVRDALGPWCIVKWASIGKAWAQVDMIRRPGE